MLRSEKRRDKISEIKNYKKYNVETIKNIERFCRRIYVIYLIWFIIFDRNTTRVKMTELYHYNIKYATKTKEIWKQYSHYKEILKW